MKMKLMILMRELLRSKQWSKGKTEDLSWVTRWLFSAGLPIHDTFVSKFDLILFITFHFFQLRSFSRDAITYPAKNKNSKYNDVP